MPRNRAADDTASLYTPEPHISRIAVRQLRALAEEALKGRERIAKLQSDLDEALEYGQRLQRRIVTQESSSGQPAPTADPTEWTDIGENMAVVQHINRETLGLRFGVPAAPFYVITHLKAPLVRRLQAFLNENWKFKGEGEVMNLPDIEVVSAKVHEAWMEGKNPRE